MTLALLHRRLACCMALAALAAFAAGAGTTPAVVLTGAVLLLALGWQPAGRTAELVERGVWLASVALFLYVAYVAFAGADILPPILALLLTLTAGEALRALDAQNDLRLYSLAFALMIAATAFYPGLGYAAAFVGYIVLATLTLLVGHLRRQSERFGVAEPPLRRQFLGLTAALAAVTVLFSIFVFAAFPRLPRGWFGQGRAAGGAPMAGFSDEVSLGQHGGRIRGNPDVVFRVEFLEGRPPPIERMYWRGRSFDYFDGTRWSRSGSMPPADLPRELYMLRWGGPPIAYRVYGGPPGAPVLFGLHPIIDLRPGSALRPTLTATGDIERLGWDSPVYTAYSAATAPPAELLRQLPEASAPAGMRYLQLPVMGAAVLELADSLTRDQTTRYDRARAVERWLHTEFAYTLDLPRSAREASVESFLLRRRAGHCEYFSTAMVVLLRAAGVPARNVTGFLGGEWSPLSDYLAVTGNAAHSWVEVWFPHVGWVAFDPTPPAGRDQVLDGARAGALRPLRLWIDGVQHRWDKWVLDYNFDHQLLVLQGVRDLFDRAAAQPADGRTAPFRVRTLIAWLVGGACVAVAVVHLSRRRAGGRPTEEARLYRELRRVYERAGYALAPAAPPLALLAALRAQHAPALDEAEVLLRLYLRARFGGEDVGLEGRARMEDALVAVRRGIRRASAPVG